MVACRSATCRSKASLLLLAGVHQPDLRQLAQGRNGTAQHLQAQSRPLINYMTSLGSSMSTIVPR